ncbi:1-phosphofructokinase family hexose kinase [Arenivirga flava]|nr:PfkB family carbohydrate kinase [Arenivirga flava]
MTQQRLVILAPSPVLTVTIEEHPDGPDVHVHAGGQGVWQARMLRSLGAQVTLCSVLSGETGLVLGPLLGELGLQVSAVRRDARGSAYVHDRRDGEREPIAEAGGEPFTRHDLDELYALTVREALAVDTVLLSGPAEDDLLPAEVYRRLAADLGGLGKRVIVDLAGERLQAALEGGVALAKVSDEELERDGLIDGPGADADERDILRAMERMRADGAEAVIVTRRSGTLLLDGDGARRVHGPEMEVVDSSGAGDSLTAATTLALDRGDPLDEAVALGTAAGALNVTRHGLGSGDGEAIHRLREHVRVEPIERNGDD